MKRTVKAWATCYARDLLAANVSERDDGLLSYAVYSTKRGARKRACGLERGPGLRVTRCTITYDDGKQSPRARGKRRSK